MYIKIKLTGNSSRENFPLGKIFINQHLLFDGMLKNTVNLNFNVDEKYLRETNVLSIEHYGKNNRDTVVDKDNNIIEDKSIELIELQINDVKILDTVLHSKPFYVFWPVNLVKDFHDKNEEVPAFITNNLYFGFNGRYDFDFSKNITKEYYNQFWLDEEQAHFNQTLVENNNEVFYRDGEFVEVDRAQDLSIFDLEKIILESTVK